jgi:hypothetical protein
MAVRNFHPDEIDDSKMSNFEHKYMIKDSGMFNDIIVYTLTEFRDYLDAYLGYEYALCFSLNPYSDVNS